MYDSCSAVAPGEGSRVLRRAVVRCARVQHCYARDLECLAYLRNWHSLNYNVRENRYVIRPWYADARPVAGLSDRGRGGQLRGWGLQYRRQRSSLPVLEQTVAWRFEAHKPGSPARRLGGTL